MNDAIILGGLATLTLLVLRFVQPRAIYGFRHLLLLIQSRKLVLEYISSDGEIDGTQFTRILMQDYRHEVADVEREIILTRVKKVRELYRLANPAREDIPDTVRRPNAAACVVELGDIVKNLGRQMDVHTEYDYPLVPADYFLTYLANQVRNQQGEAPVSDARAVADWLKHNPVSIEQTSELLIAVIIALDYRRVAAIPYDAAATGGTRRLVPSWLPGGGTRPSVQELLKDPEGKRCEFKETLRWNVHTAKKDRAMTEAVAIAMAGFMNAGGGTVLVGVTDDGEPVGLGRDRFASPDQTKRHLDNAIRDQLGTHYNARIEVCFERLGEHDVLRVDCEPVLPPDYSAPVYLKAGKRSRLFVRTQAGTQELDAAQANEFVRMRFPG